jgi:hypothetical protein
LAIRRRREPGRNDPCPCGSGKKWKKCCLLRRREIEADIRAGAQYVEGPGEFGVVKIANAPGDSNVMQTENYQIEVENGSASSPSPDVPSGEGEE